MPKRLIMSRLTAPARTGAAVLGLCLVLVGGFWGPASAATRSQVAERATTGLAQVDSLLENGQAAQAVGLARSLFAELGDDPLYGWQVEGRLGLALLRDGKPSESIPHLEAVMRRIPKDPIAHRNLASALLASGRRGRALSELQLVVELAPADFEARLEFGQVLGEFGDVAGAVEELEVARVLCQGCAQPDRMMAAILMGAGAYTEAVAPLRRLMVSGPTAGVRLDLAQALAGSGRYGELLEFLDSQGGTGLTAREVMLAAEAEGQLGVAARSLVWVQSQVEDSAQVKPSEPGSDLPGDLLTDPVFWGRVSLNLLEAGYFQEGLWAADRAIGLDGRNAVYRNNKVVLLLELGRTEEAAREWEKVLELDPSLEKMESE